MDNHDESISTDTVKELRIYSSNEEKLIFTVSISKSDDVPALKHKIEEQLNIPEERQIIYTNASSLTIQDEEPHHFVDSTLDEGMLYEHDKIFLTVSCKGDEKLEQECKKSNIKVLEIQIFTPSGNLITTYQLLPNEQISSLRSMIREELKLPIELQMLCDVHDCSKDLTKPSFFNLLNDHNNTTAWDLFGSNFVHNTTTLYLCMQRTDDRSLNEICDKFEIPLLSENVIVGDFDAKFFVRMQRYKMCTVNHTSMSGLDYMRFNIPVSSMFFVEDRPKILFGDLRPRNNKYFDQLYSTHNRFHLEPYLIADPNSKIFSETLKTLTIKFLSSEVHMDLRDKEHRRVSKVSGVKWHLSRVKNVPFRALGLYLGEKELEDDDELAYVAMQEFKNPPSHLDLHVISKKLSDYKIFLKSAYPKKLVLPVDHIFISGTKTILNLKEEVSELTGIPASQIVLRTTSSLDDDRFICYKFDEDDPNKNRVEIYKLIAYNMLEENGETSQNQYMIRDENETINGMMKNLWRKGEFQKTGKLSKDSLVFDIGNDETIQVKETEKQKEGKTNCILS